MSALNRRVYYCLRVRNYRHDYCYSGMTRLLFRANRIGFSTGTSIKDRNFFYRNNQRIAHINLYRNHLHRSLSSDLGGDESKETKTSSNSRTGILRVNEEDKELSGYEEEYFDFPLAYSAVSVQGLRESMEDRHCAVTPALQDGKLSFFGIFDGHAGSNCAEYLSHSLPKALLGDPVGLLEAPEAIISNTFLRLDKIFCDFAGARNLHDGSSALVTIIERSPESGIASRSWFACAGDSRAVIVRRSGRVKQMNREVRSMHAIILSVINCFFS